MKKLLAIFLVFTIFSILNAYSNKRGKESMQIVVRSNNKVVVFELNNSNASKELEKQLPLNIKVEDYASNEKIFYPPETLTTSNTPKANAKNGTLAYYAPWGDVAMFYKDFGTVNGLYELGKCIDGCEFINDLNGTIHIQIREK